MENAAEQALSSLRGPIVRLIIINQRLKKAIKTGDNELGQSTLDDLLDLLDQIEDSWVAYEAGSLDQTVANAVQLALDQLQRRSKHN